MTFKISDIEFYTGLRYLNHPAVTASFVSEHILEASDALDQGLYSAWQLYPAFKD